MKPAPLGPILVVEADRQLGRTLCEQLAADGYAVELARTSEHARVLSARRPPELALLGSSSSARGQLELLGEIRSGAGTRPPWDRATPVIVLAGRRTELDLLRAFDAGADDFLALDCGYLELRARIVAVLRRRHADRDRETQLRVETLTIDTRARVALLAEVPVQLRRMEYELLAHLARQPDRVHTREELLRGVWGYRADARTRTLDTHASRLRRKLARPGARAWVVNVRAIGYRLR